MHRAGAPRLPSPGRRRRPEALAIATGHSASINLLLTDMVLPDRGGPELAEQLRDTRPGLRILFSSGYAATTTVDRAALGPYAYRAKQFTTGSRPEGE